jgi:hypothetical protein
MNTTRSETRREAHLRDHRRRLRQLDEADHGGECCFLDDLDEKANRRRDGDAQGLRTDDAAKHRPSPK